MSWVGCFFEFVAFPVQLSLYFHVVFCNMYGNEENYIHVYPRVSNFNCTARQCSPLGRKFMECYIIKPAQSLLMKHLVIGQR